MVISLSSTAAMGEQASLANSGIVLRYASAGVVHGTEVVLGAGVALLGGFAVPPCRLEAAGNEPLHAVLALAQHLLEVGRLRAATASRAAATAALPASIA